MTSLRQIEANRRNALRSTGPRTENGKRRSRQNAVRHGLTAETVVVALEDNEDYEAFEAAVIADYDARTAVERELVLRLASLLWRIRRATAIETDLLQIQAEILEERRYKVEPSNEAEQGVNSVVGRVLLTEMPQDESKYKVSTYNAEDEQVDYQLEPNQSPSDNSTSNTRSLTCCFLRLANLDSGVFERLGRYEVALWRQIVHTMLLLRTARYR